VIGNTGSGKTSLSRALATKLDVPHLELDAFNWQPGWKEASHDDFRSRVAAALETDGWVVDGNYRSRLGTYVLDRADLVVWLDLPLPTILLRVVRRTVRRLRTRELLWGKNVETLRGAFFRRDSLIWWAVRTHFRWRRRLPLLVAKYPHVRLRSLRDVERFLERA
jgi:adenylate kinase family enzyme